MERKLINTVSVLCVEDDQDVLETMVRYLSRRFKTVYRAANGEEGLKIYTEHRPEVVVTDIQMPVMDGLEMSRRIKEIDPETPIIVTTAYTEIPYLIDAIEIGIDGYVSKPVISENLYRVIGRSALKFIHRRVVTAKNTLIQTLMDWQPSFSILISGENLDYVNRAFLRFMGYESMDEFLRHHDCIEDFIVTINDGANVGSVASERWFRQIIDNPQSDHILHLKAKGNVATEAYLVRYRCFEEIDQYLFAFFVPDALGRGENPLEAGICRREKG